MRPERSGTPRPERSLPAGKDSGGNVTGMRITVAGRPPSSLQNVLPSRLLRTPGREGGTQALTAANAPAPAARPASARTTGAPARRRGREAHERGGGGRDRRVCPSEEQRLRNLPRDGESGDAIGRIALQEIED